MSSIFGSLVAPMPLLPVSDLGPVHFIAAGGAGMAPIAELYVGRDVEVSGSDRVDSANLTRLRELGVVTHVGHAADQLGAAGTVVVSSAIGEDNPEVVAARERGVRLWHRSTALAALMQPTDAAPERIGIAVGGTHGKTTTSGMLAHIFTETGADPGFVIGAPLATNGRAAADGVGPFVVEADESDGSFRQYPARIALVTNVEADHLDNWETTQAYADGFVEFASAADIAIINVLDPGGAALAERLDAAVRVGDSGEWTIEDVTAEGFGSTAWLTGPEGRYRLSLQVPGVHNVHNAAMAVAAAAEAGVAAEDAVDTLSGFRSTARRFTPHGVVNGVSVFDDYAHHPTEIDATLRAARAGVGEGRVLACFQPHLYSRTRDFAREFGEALALADRAFITDVYGAREDPMPGVDADLLVTTCRDAGGAADHVPAENLPEVASAWAEPGDIVLTLGAGDITHIAPRIVEALHDR